MTNTTTEIYVARHAESAMNVAAHLVGGRSNHAPLSKPQGEFQATEFGLWMKDAEFVPDAVYATPALRTQLTAKFALLAAGLDVPVGIRENLQELSQGIAEGRPRTEVYIPDVVAEIEELHLDFAFEGGESKRQAGERTLDDYRELALLHPNQKVLVFGHGFNTRCAAGLLLGWTQEEILTAQTDNVSLSRFEATNGKITVDFIGKNVVAQLTHPENVQ